MSGTASSEKRESRLSVSVISLVAVLLLMLGAFLYGRFGGDRGAYTALESKDKRGELVASMLVSLHASAEAEKSSVMAQTDETSISFANEARQASSALEQSRRELERLVGFSNRPAEAKQLEEFDHAWKAYRELEDEILSLAVENTNLKAQRLSFGPARETLERFETALKMLSGAGSTSTAVSAASNASEALAAALKIHSLQAIHIAETRDEEMDKIESEMKDLDRQVREHLGALANVSAESQERVREAEAAYADFQKVNSELRDLSRRNTNVRSLALSLGKKRNATAVCRELLQSLREMIDHQEFGASR